MEVGQQLGSCGLMHIGGRPAVRPPPINRAPSCSTLSCTNAALRQLIVTTNIPTRWFHSQQFGQQCGHTYRQQLPPTSPHWKSASSAAIPYRQQLPPNWCKLEVGQQLGSCGLMQNANWRSASSAATTNQSSAVVSYTSSYVIIIDGR